MRRRLLRVASLAIVLALALLASPAAQRGPDTSNHVVIISLDGFGGWALDDPYLPVPTLRRLASAGAMSKAMRPMNPTVTWANHTSIVTGVTPAKHGVIFNGLLIRQPGVPPRVEPWRDKKTMVRVRTLYDAVHDRGMTTAQVDWVAIQNPGTITWEFAERPSADAAVSRELIKANVISAADLASFPKQNILWRDSKWTDAAAFILREHRPNLLLFHLLNLDSTQHRYGPRSPAASTAMAHLDTAVATILDTIERAGLTAKTTVFVVSDHGFKVVKRRIYPNAAFLKAGLIHARDGKVSDANAFAVPEGGTAFVYVTKPDPSGALLNRVRQALAGIEGIERIVEASEYPRFNLPLPAANDQMGALMLVAKNGYAFSDSTSEPVVADSNVGGLGAHGYLNTDPDLSALFIAAGRGITRGAALGAIDNLSVAPTAAQLLGVTLDGVEGRVLKEILVP